MPYSARGSGLAAPCPLSNHHDLTQFNCGSDDLNSWLRRQARRSDGRTARTYVAAAAGQVVGYYCLAAGAIMRSEVPTSRLRRNTPEQVPVVIIGRLAVDSRHQRQGIGSGLVKDAVLRTVRASVAVGIRAILVHALDDRAGAFYRDHNFIPSPKNERMMILPIETAIAAL